MRQIIGILVLAAIAWYGYQAGWFSAIANYFSDSYSKAKQEQVVRESDGSVTTVRYRSFLDILTGK